MRLFGCLLVLVCRLWGSVSWSTPITLSNAGNAAATPSLAISYSTGRAIAAWRTSSAPTACIQVSLYDGTSWSSPVILSNTGYDSDKPKVKINDLGHAIVLWRRSLTMSKSIIEATFYNGVSWSDAATLSTSPTVDNPSLSMNPSSDEAMAIWRDSVGLGKLQTALFDGANWSLIGDFHPETNPNSTPISMNSANNAIIAWISQDSVRTIYTSLYNGAWSSPTSLPSDNTSVMQATVAMNPSGSTAAAAWSTIGTVDAAFWDSGAWQFARVLGPENGFFVEPQVAFNPVDNTVAAIWRGSNGVQGATFNLSSWSNPQTIADVGINPSIACNPIDGNVGVIWRNTTGVQFAEYNSATSTTPITLSGSGSPNDAPRIAIDASGNVLAMWTLANGSGTTVQVARGTSTR